MTATAVARQLPAESAATVRQVHATMIKPASEVIFDIGREEPTDNEKWTAISTSGATLVKSGDLLIRAAPPEGRAKWISLSRQLAAAGREARSAAEARNLDALQKTPDRLVLVCESCHAAYRTPEPSTVVP